MMKTQQEKFIVLRSCLIVSNIVLISLRSGSSCNTGGLILERLLDVFQTLTAPGTKSTQLQLFLYRNCTYYNRNFKYWILKIQELKY